MKNNNKNTITSKSSTQGKNQTSSKSTVNQMTSKTNQMKANPDKRERRDGPGGE